MSGLQPPASSSAPVSALATSATSPDGRPKTRAPIDALTRQISPDDLQGGSVPYILGNNSTAKESNMPLVLPSPIAAYFAADKRDGTAVAECFSQDATVRDEGRTYTGLSEIRSWKEVSSSKYEYTSEPASCESKDGATIVTSRLTGRFPGSPVNVRYVFKLRGDKIGSLKIVP